MKEIPLSRKASREVDRIATEELGIPGVVLMENAGRGCAEAMERIGVDGLVVVFCGKGNNGGDGFVLARHLALRGHEVQAVLTAPPETLAGDAKVNYKILQNARSPQVDLSSISASKQMEHLDRVASGADWMVDALLGTGARGDPQPPFDTFIDWMNAEPAAKKLAVDLPSGLDCDTGRPGSPTVQADHTCTFVAPKLGFQAKSAQEYLGEVHVVGIGAPQCVLERVLQASEGTRG